jgi:hypothetical protein
MLLKERVSLAIQRAVSDADTTMLRQSDGRVSGPVVAPSFAGRSTEERVHLLWSALRQELGDDARYVGVLLPFAPGEGA